MLVDHSKAVVTYQFRAIEARVSAHARTFPFSACPSVHTLDLVTQFDVTPQTDVTRATHAAPFQTCSLIVTDDVQTLVAFAEFPSVRLWTVTFDLFLVEAARAVVFARRVVAVTFVVEAHTVQVARSFTDATEAVYFVDACAAILAGMTGAFVDVYLAVAT